MIKLHPQLEKDSTVLGEFSLCTLLLINDANYPWFVLVPNCENITELHQLEPDNQQQFWAESMYFSQCLDACFKPDKLNIAALGNVVPQLHIHHIVRYKSDACWPSPVWGRVEASDYTKENIQETKTTLKHWFENNAEQTFQWI